LSSQRLDYHAFICLGSWVPDSGWPISYNDFLPYYKKAADLCQIGRYQFDAQTAFPNSQKEILQGLDSEKLVSYPLERWSPPVHFGKAYQTTLENSTNIQVLMDAHMLAIQTENDKDTVT
jgi:choline dehydrogenase-like flavoprotein